MELKFEYIESGLPEVGKLLGLEKHTHLENRNVCDNWLVVEKIVANVWCVISADNQYYYLEKM